MVGAIDDFASRIAQIQGDVFANMLDRSQLTLKVALANRLSKELAAIDAKYTGKAAARIEDRINTLFDEKQGLADTLKAVKDTLNLRGVASTSPKLNQVREYLLEMKLAVDLEDTATFDGLMADLENKVGSAVVDPNNLIGNPGPDVTAPRTIVTGTGRVSTTVQSVFLGSDYAITLGDGSVRRPDFENQTLGGIAFADYSLVSLSGDTIRFRDGTGGITTGTLTRRGGEILSAWMYDGFAQTADKDQAKADIDAAIKRVADAELAFTQNIALLGASVDRVGTQMTDLTKEFKKVGGAELDAKQAEQKAATARFELTLHSMALTSQVSLTFVQSLFLGTSTVEKQDVFGILNDQVASS